jgi:hypothetical protein
MRDFSHANANTQIYTYTHTSQPMDQDHKNELRQHIDELRRVKMMIDALIDSKIREQIKALDEDGVDKEIDR